MADVTRETLITEYRQQAKAFRESGQNSLANVYENMADSLAERLI